MKDHQNMESILWDYIDKRKSAEENIAIEKLVSENHEWQLKYQEFLSFQKLLKADDLEQPSMRFTKNVMDEIARFHIAPATKNYINKKIIWGIAIFFLTVIISFLVYGISQVDWTMQNDSKFPIDFSQIDYSKFFNSQVVNVFMMINVVLAIFLLDHFLTKRLRKFQSNS